MEGKVSGWENNYVEINIIGGECKVRKLFFN